MLELVLPPLSAACREPVGGEVGFCAACLARPPAFATARALLAYDEDSRAAILALKHADRLELVPVSLAGWCGWGGHCWRIAT